MSLRTLKVDSDATSGTVSGVTYSGNSVSGISKYGILITQSYSEDFGTPGTDTTIRRVSSLYVPDYCIDLGLVQ